MRIMVRVMVRVAVWTRVSYRACASWGNSSRRTSYTTGLSAYIQGARGHGWGWVQRQGRVAVRVRFRVNSEEKI